MKLGATEANALLALAMVEVERIEQERQAVLNEIGRLASHVRGIDETLNALYRARNELRQHVEVETVREKSQTLIATVKPQSLGPTSLPKSNGQHHTPMHTQANVLEKRFDNLSFGVDEIVEMYKEAGYRNPLKSARRILKYIDARRNNLVVLNRIGRRKVYGFKNRMLKGFPETGVIPVVHESSKTVEISEIRAAGLGSGWLP